MNVGMYGGELRRGSRIHAYPSIHACARRQFVTIATDRKTSEMMAQAMMPEVAGEDSPLAKQIKETFQAHTV